MLAIQPAPNSVAAASPLVSVNNVQKTYFTRQAPVQAVASASVNIARGEFVSLLGPSGCGKSTLLMMMAGLERPTGGSILLGGSEIKEPRRDIGIDISRYDHDRVFRTIPELVEDPDAFRSRFLEFLDRPDRRAIGERLPGKI